MGDIMTQPFLAFMEVMTEVIHPDVFWENEWTSVYEQMPTPDTSVLLYVDCGPYNMMVVGKLKTKGWYVTSKAVPQAGDGRETSLCRCPVGDLDLGHDIEIKAWMPLPEPPKD